MYVEILQNMILSLSSIQCCCCFFLFFHAIFCLFCMLFWSPCFYFCNFINSRVSCCLLMRLLHYLVLVFQSMPSNNCRIAIGRMDEIFYWFLFLSIWNHNFHLTVSFHVQCQMIRTWKASIAVTAFKWFSTGVFSIMARKLVATSKSPFTTIPRAFVWLFTCF